MIGVCLIAIAAAIAATPSRVYVAGGEHAEQLSAALAKEPDLIVGTATSADAIVSLTPATSALILVVKEADGATALERRIDLDRGIDPALRMAVLLIRGALEPLREPAVVAPMTPVASRSATVAPVASVADKLPEHVDLTAESPRTFAIEVTPAIAAADLASFDPAGALYVHVRLGRFAIGVSGMYAAGVGGKQGTRSVEGAMRDAWVMLDGAWTFIDNDPLAFALFGAAGIDFLRATTHASRPPYASEGTPNDVDAKVPVIVLGLDGKIDIAGWLAIDVRAGARILPQRIEVGLPQAFVDENPLPEAVTPLKSSVVSIFLSIGTTIEVF